MSSEELTAHWKREQMPPCKLKPKLLLSEYNKSYVDPKRHKTKIGL